MFRKTSGSSLCPSCGKLNSVNAPVCFYCGRRNPGLWGFGPAVGRLLAEINFTRIVTVVCIAAYVVSLLLDVRSAMRVGGLFGILAPSSAALYRLGMTGGIPWALGWWWTLITAIYLHGSVIHLVFNLLVINQLAPAVEELYGRSRLILIFTGAGIMGFAVSNLVSGNPTIGASGSFFGLLGAMVAYGRSRGGTFGVLVLRQYGLWALVALIFGFLLPAVNNSAHVGGFISGYLLSMVLGYSERRREDSTHHLAATGAIALTALSFALALWNGFAS